MNMLSILLLLVATTAAAQNTPPEVTHVWAQQRSNTQLVDVNYSLADLDNGELSVSLVLLTGSGAVICPCISVTGDVGAGIAPGANKHITWDAGADLFGQYGSDYTLRVVADDGVASVPVGFVLIPPGTYTMGSPPNEPGREFNETQHQVTLTHGIYVQTSEVTNQQYMEMAQWAYDHGNATVVGDNLRDNLDGSSEVLKKLGYVNYEIIFSNGVFSCLNPANPVRDVSWYGSAAYCDWLSLREGLPRVYNHSTWQCNEGNPYAAVGYRLPTDAEWEYACRAGSSTAFANGPIAYPNDCIPLDANLALMGWYCGNSGGGSARVAQKLPNAWGQYDMHGNLREWCNDYYYASYGGGAVTDPVGPGTGFYRVVRGGSILDSARSCRSACRYMIGPTYLSSFVGFRPVRSAN